MGMEGSMNVGVAKQQVLVHFPPCNYNYLVAFSGNFSVEPLRSCHAVLSPVILLCDTQASTPLTARGFFDYSRCFSNIKLLT